MKPPVRLRTQAIGAMPPRSRATSMHLVADVGGVRRIGRPVAADAAIAVAISSSCSKISMTQTKSKDLAKCAAHIDELRDVNSPLPLRCASSSTISPVHAGADIADEHWEMLFNAVIERLEAAAGHGIETREGPHGQVEIDRVRSVVLECVEALRQLKATSRP